MTTFFLTCAAHGGGILVVQLLLGMLGVIDGMISELEALETAALQ